MRRLLFLAPAQAVSAVFAPLRDAGFELGMAENMKGASLFLEKSDPGVIFARPSMPGFKVEELLTFGADKAEFPPVIIITDKGDAREAERLMSLGARDYWLEPLDMERIAAVAREPRAPVPVPALSTLGGHKPSYEKGPQIVGHAPAIRRVLKLARQVAGSKATVLISGESGTGKEMFSRYLHAMSKRASGPFIAVNCAALPEALVESASGLLLTGGADVDPKLYGEEKSEKCGAILSERDEAECALTRAALREGLPVLAICRGLQVLNVVAGGTLIQDIPEELGLPLTAHRQEGDYVETVHEVEIVPGTLLASIVGEENLAVNTKHHQAVKTPASSLRVVAKSPDGVVEALEDPAFPFVLGVQWHPEMLAKTMSRHRALFEAFVRAAREI